MQAIILAAGRGTRLQPLTHSTPKPLLDIAPGRTLIGDALKRLADGGFGQVLINSHHLAEQLHAYVADLAPALNLEIIWSEEASLLDTGGALGKMRPHLRDDRPALVMAADIWTDCPIQAFAGHSMTEAAMHLMLVPNPDYHPRGDFDFAAEGDGPGLLCEARTNRFNYGGMALIWPSLISRISDAVFPLYDLMRLALQEQALTGEIWHGDWFNVGTITELEALRARLGHS